MAKILIVDDSLTDRRLAGRILQKYKDWTVFYAENGEAALRQIELERPDVVLTDLIMPEMDGLELVNAVRTTHPLVPVVLMTAKGNEEIAVQAIQSGAASYVPKKVLAQTLVETLERILAGSSEQESYRRVLTRLHQSLFVIENDLDLISSLVSYLVQTVRDMGLFEESECLRITTALDEAISNAYFHGNLEVSSTIREQDRRAYKVLADERRTQSPYRERRIRVTSQFRDGVATFSIRDDGPGFDVASLPDPTDLDFLHRPTGRGVFLMRTFMDEVRFNRKGNEVTLLKRPTDDDSVVNC